MGVSGEEDYDYVFKLIMVGDSGVGKSNLVARFARDEFIIDSKSTIGVEFATKSIMVDNIIVKAGIWDMADQVKYVTIRRTYYRGAAGAFLVYDISRTITFENVEERFKEIKEYGDSSMLIALIGNKCDCDVRKVSTEEAKAFAEDKGILFLETSALDSTNVEEAFHKLLTEIYRASKKNSRDENSFLSSKGITLNLGKTKKEKKGCCF